jgi:hypothetical protein
VKHTPLSPRTPVRFSESLDHKLSLYTLAASAAGVGVLALAQPAEAKIIYTKTWAEITPNSKLALDLNHDGIADFNLSNHVTSVYFVQDSFKVLANNNAVWGTGSYASALPGGVRIGPGKRFRPSHNLMAVQKGSCSSARCFYSSKGPWINATGRYLGLRFSIKGEIHYGWARLDVTVTHDGVYAALTGYAYETIPNTPIVTGKTKGPDNPTGSWLTHPAPSNVPATQPRSLGFLAQGARALDIWRQRDGTEE